MIGFNWKVRVFWKVGGGKWKREGRWERGRGRKGWGGGWGLGLICGEEPDVSESV